MEINERFVDGGIDYDVMYSDAESFEDLPIEQISQHYGICFYEDKIVIGWHEQKTRWTLLGGKIEPGETVDNALIREVREESNMRVLQHRPIGYQRIIRSDGSFVYQLRSFCIVEPIADFVSDPSGGVTKIKLIDSKDWNEYIDWGAVGVRILERALQFRATLS